MATRIVPTLTFELVRSYLHYDPESGDFTWIRRSGHVMPGQKAGSFTSRGYWQISFCGRSHLAHRIAWLWMTGEDAPELIDHLDNQHGNNRWSNLRAATTNINQQNHRAARSDNKSGLLGVSNLSSGKWRAAIHKSGKQFHLGSFDTPEAAHSAYLEAKRRLHPGCTI